MTPLVIAHRGACWNAPENTLEAFELAIEEGADYVEFDVRDREGELVICHNPGPPAGVATLEEALGLLCGRVGLAVELKEPNLAERTLQALRKHDVDSDELVFLSFLADELDAAVRLQPGVRTGLHLGPRPDPSTGMRFWGVGFGEPAQPESVRQAQSLGLATLVFTVNEPARMRELVELGVTGIFSDRPGLLRETLASLPGPKRERSRPETSP
jgi:glycerophosphoryl diester phosphodiesterase